MRILGLFTLLITSISLFPASIMLSNVSKGVIDVLSTFR